MNRAGIILGHPVGVVLPRLRQADWADRTTMTSVHVSRRQARMARAGVICRTWGAIAVADPGKLTAFAGFDILSPATGAMPDWLRQ